MIKKEFYKTRKDGVNLYKTYSDTEHLIKKVSDNTIYVIAIDISEDIEYEEIEGYIPLKGPESYDEIMAALDILNKAIAKVNRLNLSNNEALSVKQVYPTWESKINKTIEAGYITQYNDELWKARQTHTALEIYPPSINTSSLYEKVEYIHEGTINDPIPYTPPMEIFKDKYYIEDNITYLCTRNSDVALSHNLKNLVGVYVETL